MEKISMIMLNHLIFTNFNPCVIIFNCAPKPIHFLPHLSPDFSLLVVGRSINPQMRWVRWFVSPVLVSSSPLVRQWLAAKVATLENNAVLCNPHPRQGVCKITMVLLMVVKTIGICNFQETSLKAVSVSNSFSVQLTAITEMLSGPEKKKNTLSFVYGQEKGGRCLGF